MFVCNVNFTCLTYNSCYVLSLVSCSKEAGLFSKMVRMIKISAAGSLPKLLVIIILGVPKKLI